MKIHIPNSAFLGNIDAFLAGFDPADPAVLDITTNDRWISVHPMVLSMIGALGLTVGPRNVHFDEITARSGSYLKTMGLFDLLKVPAPMHVAAGEPTGRFIPLSEINDSATLSRFITELIPLLHLPPHQTESVQYIVSELVRNVLEHSLSPHGAVVSAQYFRKTNTVRIGIADTGVGIWKTIHQTHTAKNDIEALHLALTPGVTGTTNQAGGTENNVGAGLFFVKSIAKINRDFFAIYSGKALYKLLKPDRNAKRFVLYVDPADDKHSERTDLPAWEGTVVGIDLSLDATSEFAALLEAIGSTFDRAITERRRAKFKKPRFI